jgi:type IV pilus assembly protein PilQ
MRLKYLAGILLLLLCGTVGAVAATSGSQLTGVTVTPGANSAVIALRTTGSITHSEYHADEYTLEVDLVGTSAASLLGSQKTFDSPVLKSYKVLSYKSANGTETARVEIKMPAGVNAKVAAAKDGLEIHLEAPGKANAQAAEPKSAPQPAAASAPAPSAKPAPQPAVAKVQPAVEGPKPAAHLKTASLKTTKSSAPVAGSTIDEILVSRAKDGLEIAIMGANEAKPLLLANPDRLVIDIPDAVPAVRNRNIYVNSDDVKAIRVGRFQQDPPVTRVVVDLKGHREYSLNQLQGKVVVKVQSAAPAKSSADAKPAAAEAKPTPVSAQAAATPVPAQSAAAPAPQAEKKSVVAKPAASKAIAKKRVAEPGESFATAPTAAPRPAPTPTLAAATPQPAQQFAFVEPTYKKKDPALMAEAAAQTLSSSAPPQQPEAPSTSQVGKPGPAVNMAAEQLRMSNINSPNKPKYSGEPISVNLRDVDLKDFFRLISEISGLNIVLDPTVSGRETLVLNDVPWDQALDIVLQNHSLDRQMEGNVLRIASVETLKKEADLRTQHQQALAKAVETQTVTRFLSYAHSKDVMTVVKKFLSERGDVIADDRTNALIIRDIPTVLPTIDRLVTQLDRKTQQVEIEARVVAATRNFARDLGVQLGFAWGNGPSAVGGANSVGTATQGTGSNYYNKLPTIGAAGSGSSSGGSSSGSGSGSGSGSSSGSGSNSGTIPLFSNLPATTINSGLALVNATKSYAIDAVLTMAESRGLLKVLSRPRIVTQNNITAVVRQGMKLPIVTAAQLGGPSTTQYVDAFLRLTVTPQITAENTIFLAVDVENTTPDFGNEVNGQPTLVTQQATTQVLVTDGGTVVIGGVIQTSNSVNVNQTPMLGNIPVLGNLFKSRQVKTSTQELIFFISPKIVVT